MGEKPMKKLKGKKHSLRLPGGQGVGAMLAGEVCAYALFGRLGLPELPLFAIALTAGAAAGLIYCRRARGTEKTGGPPGLTGTKRPPQETPKSGPCIEDPHRQAAITLAGQLMADARRLLVQEAALRDRCAKQEQEQQAFLSGLQERAERFAGTARQLAAKGTKAARQAADSRTRTHGDLSQELGQAAFLANLLALRLQQAPQADEKSAGQAAAEGLRLLAARCARCGKRLAGEKEDGAIGQMAAYAGQLEAALAALQELQPPQAAAPGGQGENLRQTAGELTGHAQKLLYMLQEKRPAPRPDGPREGAIEGTGLRYRLVE